MDRVEPHRNPAFEVNVPWQHHGVNPRPWNEPPETGRLRLMIRWYLQTRDLVTVDQGGQTVLQVQTARECEITTIRVEFPGAPLELKSKIGVGEQVAAVGLRRVPKCGRHGPYGYQGIGGYVIGQPILYERLEPPNYWWHWCGRNKGLLLSPGYAVGIVVATNMPAACKVFVGGE